MNNQKVYIFHYLILALVLLAGLIFLFMYQSQPEIQLIIGAGLALSYFSWGILHHYLLEDLHKKHVVEYGLLAIFGVILLKIILV